MPSKSKCPVLPQQLKETPSKIYAFSEGEYKKRVAVLNDNKAAGRDNVLVAQLKISVPKPTCGCSQCSRNASEK